MKWILLFDILALLLLLPCAETKSTAPTPLPLKKTDGPKCARWLYGTEPPQVEAFQCAEQPDGAEVKFCCGTCGQAPSCSFQELAEGSAEGPIDGSAEGPTDGFPVLRTDGFPVLRTYGGPAVPTDGGQERCPTTLSATYWVRILWFCGGSFATVVFYWAAPRICGRLCRKKTNSRETQEDIEMQVPSSVTSRNLPGPSTTPSSRSAPSSFTRSGTLPCRPGRLPFASTNGPIAQAQLWESGGGRIMLDPREPMPFRDDAYASLPNRGRRSRPRPSN